MSDVGRILPMGTILDRDGNPIEIVAKDGQKFDQDLQHGEPKEPDEVEIIQFLATSGKRRRMLAKLSSKEIADKADDLILSCEILSTGEVAIYGRRIGEGPEDDITIIAVNGPGPKEPSKMLEKIIELIKRPDEIKEKLESNDGTQYVLAFVDEDGPQSIWALYDTDEGKYFVGDEEFDTAEKAVKYMKGWGDITEWVEVVTG